MITKKKITWIKKIWVRLISQKRRRRKKKGRNKKTVKVYQKLKKKELGKFKLLPKRKIKIRKITKFTNERISPLT